MVFMREDLEAVRELELLVLDFGQLVSGLCGKREGRKQCSGNRGAKSLAKRGVHG
jgi:hypothetical protein